MQKATKRNLIGQFLLLTAAISWGSSFVILKDAMEKTPGLFIIGLRFLVCGIIFSLIFIKKLIKLDKKTLVHGLILGSSVAMAYIVQTIGLKYTTPSRNAFLTNLYCIICPFLIWAMYKIKPKSYNVISAVLCIVGIGLIAFSNPSESSASTLLGDGLTVICAFFFSLQIIFIDRYQTKENTAELLTINFLVVGVVVLISSLIFELPFTPNGIKDYALNGDQLLKIGYLLLVCTMYAQFAQAVGQKLSSSPSQSAIILSLESVFGTIFSIILGGEQVTTMLICGFAVIFVAMLISELKLDVMKLFKKKASESLTDIEEDITEKENLE